VKALKKAVAANAKLPANQHAKQAVALLTRSAKTIRSKIETSGAA
jgi:hypothetical protein